MPIYEYVCPGCGQTYEVFQRVIGDGPPPTTKHPGCGGTGQPLAPSGITTRRGLEWARRQLIEEGPQSPREPGDLGVYGG